MPSFHSFVSLALVVWAVGCGNAAESSESLNRASSPDRSQNHSDSDDKMLLTAAECVQATLTLHDIKALEAIRGHVAFRSTCDQAVTVLVAPVEVRVRNDKSVIHWEGMGSPFARLYIFSRSDGAPRFVGDAGASVQGIPDRVNLDPRASTEVTVRGSETAGLAAGTYGAYLETYAFSGLRASTPAVELDLANTIRRWNEKHPDSEVFRVPGALPFRSQLTYFNVK